MNEIEEKKDECREQKGLECQERKGLECRYCGCRVLKVVYTRAKPGKSVMRRRECRQCGQRVTTWEREIGALGPSKEAE